MTQEASSKIGSSNIKIRVRMSDSDSIVVEAKIDEDAGMVIEL